MSNQYPNKKNDDNTTPCFKYRPSQPRYHPISFFACYRYDMRKSFAISFAAKYDQYFKYKLTSRPISEISADKSPNIGRFNARYIVRYEITYLLHDCVQMYIVFYYLCIHITSFLLGR